MTTNDPVAPTFPPAPPPARGPSPLVAILGGGLALALGAVAVGAGFVAVDAGHDADAARAAGTVALRSQISPDLFDGLQNERNFAAVYLLGQESALALPVASFDEATGRTDAALTRFRADLASGRGAPAQAFSPRLERLDDQLGDLREQVSGYDGQRGLNNLAVSEPVYDGYTSLLDGLLAADRTLESDLDDPSLRRGTQLMELGRRQALLSNRVARGLLVAGVTGDGRFDPAEVRAVSADLGKLQATRASIDELAIGEYGAAGRDLAAADQSAELADLTRVASSGTGPVPVVAVTKVGGAEPYTRFQAGVTRAMTERIDQRVDDASARRDRALLVAAGAAVLAILVGAVTVAFVVGRGRRPA